MPKTLIPQIQYSGRPAGVVPVNFTLDRDAVELLIQLAPGLKARGRFVSRLIFEYAARQEERTRLHQQMVAAFTPPEVQDGQD
jgi:hypothetical protein